MASAVLSSTLKPSPKVLVHIFDHCAAFCSTAVILAGMRVTQTKEVKVVEFGYQQILLSFYS